MHANPALSRRRADIPATPVGLETRRRNLRAGLAAEHQQGEIRFRAARQHFGPADPQTRVGRAMSMRAGLNAAGALELPVHLHGVIVAAGDAAVISGQHIGRQILAHIVDQQARAADQPVAHLVLQQDRAAHLLLVRIGDRTGHIDIAVTRLGDQLIGAAKTIKHGVNLKRWPRAGGRLQPQQNMLTGHQGRPQIRALQILAGVRSVQGGFIATQPELDTVRPVTGAQLETQRVGQRREQPRLPALLRTPLRPHPITGRIQGHVHPQGETMATALRRHGFGDLLGAGHGHAVQRRGHDREGQQKESDQAAEMQHAVWVRSGRLSSLTRQSTSPMQGKRQKQHERAASGTTAPAAATIRLIVHTA